MRDLLISRKADNDLVAIADYTIATFGIAQARKYRDHLQACFDSLLENPLLGRTAGELAPGLRRIRQQAHVVFYTADAGHVLIVRVLHHRMDFDRHL
jgi:toxin ParE1/3/4